MSGSLPTPTPVHRADQSRFEVSAAGEPAVLEYRLEGAVMVIDRTFVPESLRGQGVAAVLAQAAFGHARDTGLRVRPECSYIETFLKRHPEWAELSTQPRD